tara:strand:- start:372 stop:1229 length:858 start_codon:yes stop_codon:yes gene_type:complete
MLKLIRFSHFPKNLLILFPVLLSNKLLNFNNFEIMLSSLLIFFFLTSSCYLINDYTDRDSDKINKLKSYNDLNDNNYIILFSFIFLLFLFLVIYFKQYNIISIYLYLINFVIYNFVSKKIKFLDIFFLANFYLFRILYGFEIFNLEFSYGFIGFCSSFFLALSVLKRLIQIKINNLKKKNLIIPYNLNDCRVLERLLNIFFTINIFIFLLFLIYNFKIFDFQFIVFAYSYSLTQLFLIFLAYFIFLLRIIKTYRDGKIKEDIYKFVLQDKVTYLILIIVIFAIIL